MGRSETRVWLDKPNMLSPENYEMRSMKTLITYMQIINELFGNIRLDT